MFSICSDPRYQDPRNLPKYDNNRQNVPKDRYDSKYRYYERFPDRQRDRLRDPNYDPREGGQGQKVHFNSIILVQCPWYSYSRYIAHYIIRY